MKNKETYLERLKILLESFDVLESEMIEILNDYELMYEDAYQYKSNEEVWETLGSPESVFKQLRETLKKKEKRARLIDVTGFVSLLVVGLFLLIGFQWQVWHPTWLLFLLIPMSGLLNNDKLSAKIISLATFGSVIAFVLVGHYTGMWHPTWLVFFAGIIAGIIFNRKALLVKFINVSVLISVIIIYAMFYQNHLFLLLFIIPIISFIVCGYIQVVFDFNQVGINKSKGLVLLITAIACITLFLVFGIVFHQWQSSWLFFFIFPLVAMLLYKEKDLEAYTFILTTVAYLLIGFYAQIWHPTWLIFLLIPLGSTLYTKKRRNGRSEIEDDLEDIIDEIEDSLEDMIYEIEDYVEEIVEASITQKD